jgi:hypothetical protein
MIFSEGYLEVYRRPLAVLERDQGKSVNLPVKASVTKLLSTCLVPFVLKRIGKAMTLRGGQCARLVAQST